MRLSFTRPVTGGGGQKWACGEEAKARLAGLIEGRQVSCATSGVDDFGRLLARCTVGGVELNRHMVLTGFAVAFRRYSTDYVSEEARAKGARQGLWAGNFQMPSEYRQVHRGTAPGSITRTTGVPRPATTNRRASAGKPPVGNRGDCDIKGNRNRRGQWIYHMPGMPYYGPTRAEQMFCSEAEAQAAGYRRAIVR